MCVLRLEGRGRVERSVRAIKAPPESLPTTDYRSTSGTPINGRPPASPEHPGRKLITNQIQIRSKLRWPLQTITWSRGRLASVITWPFREPHPCRRSCRSSSNWIRAMCARGRSGWSLRALRWRAIGLRRDQRRTIRPRQRRRLPATPPLRSWRRGSIVSRWMWKPHWSGCISTKRLVCLGVIGAPTAVVNMSVLDAHSRTRLFVGLKFGDVILRVVTRAISTCQ
jgi:hypothetical protein